MENEEENINCFDNAKQKEYKAGELLIVALGTLDAFADNRTEFSFLQFHFRLRTAIILESGTSNLGSEDRRAATESERSASSDSVSEQAFACLLSLFSSLCLKWNCLLEKMEQPARE
ncbi:hypothetical protein STEG23_011897, partial [Scotinomys teguina]